MYGMGGIYFFVNLGTWVIQNARFALIKIFVVETLGILGTSFIKNPKYAYEC